MFTYEYPHPAVTVDVALFDRLDGRDVVLLILRGSEPFAGLWALPGGFIDIDEDLEPAARRELLEETGLEAGTLKQVGTYGRPDRDPRERIITVVYSGRPAQRGARPCAASDAADAAWHRLDTLPPLASDHAEIIRDALDLGIE
jgi:8-oxo-dGTP diphosphatase